MDYKNWGFHGAEPVYLQLYEKLRYCIFSGKLCPGEHLPSIRELASSIKINPNTVGRIYQLIHQQGLITCARGKGYCVTSDTHLIQKERHRQVCELSHTYFQKMRELGFSKNEAIDALNSYMQTVGI